jgi:hypothetical protein
VRTGGGGGALYFRGENPSRDAAINYYLGPSADGEVEFEISDITGETTWRRRVAAVPGINRLNWNMNFDPSAEEMGRIVEQINEAITNFLEEASRQQERQVGRLQRELGEAGTDFLKVSEILGQLNEASGRSYYFRRIGMRGAPAEPGEYLVRMTFNGMTHTGNLTIRRDPLLDKD